MTTKTKEAIRLLTSLRGDLEQAEMHAARAKDALRRAAEGVVNKARMWSLYRAADELMHNAHAAIRDVNAELDCCPYCNRIKAGGS